MTIHVTQLGKGRDAPRLSTPPVRKPPARPTNTILVPFDFTPASEHALDYAISHARSSDTPVRILHVLEPVRGAGLLERGRLLELRSRAVRDARKRLGAVVTAKQCDNVPLIIEIRTGLPEYEILKAADASNAGLIIMGRRVRGVLSRWIFGSVTENVLEGARHPVLVLNDDSG